MRAERLQDLEEVGTKLQASAHELPPGHDHDDALREIAGFRARIAALPGADLRASRAGLKAKR
jgi:hypothetical protein